MMMDRPEKYVQYVKVLLLTAILLLSATLLFILFGPRQPTAEAQLGASGGFNYAHITTATTTSAKPAPGTLHNLVINGGTLTGLITITDTSASNCTGGTVIAIIAANQVAGQNYEYDLQFVNGLCVTTAAAVDATVMTR